MSFCGDSRRRRLHDHVAFGRDGSDEGQQISMSSTGTNSAGIERNAGPPRRGCVIVALAVVVGVVVLGGGIFVGVLGLLKHSEAYELAVTRLQASPAAADVLGAPISA